MSVCLRLECLPQHLLRYSGCDVVLVTRDGGGVVLRDSTAGVVSYSVVAAAFLAGAVTEASNGTVTRGCFIQFKVITQHLLLLRLLLHSTTALNHRQLKSLLMKQDCEACISKVLQPGTRLALRGPQ